VTDTTGHAGRGHWLALGAIVLLAAVSRAVLLREPIRYDEAYTFLAYAARPLGDISGFYNLPNNHVLNSVLMHESVRVLGNHLWSLRVPAFAAGVALVPVAYGAGRALYTPSAGLWAAALTASSAPMIDFAVIARGYAIGLFFVLLALWMAALAVNGARWWPWPVFAACGALAFWSVPTMGPGMAVVAAWAGATLLLARRIRTLAALVAASVAAGVIAYLLYRPTLGQPGWDVGKEAPRNAGAMWDLAKATWASWSRAIPGPVELVVAAAVGAGLALHRRVARGPVPILAAAALVLFASLVTGLGAGRFPRYWLAYLPFVLLTAGAGVAGVAAALPRPRFAPAVPVAVAAVLAALVLAAGQDGAEEPPAGDNEISAYLRGVTPEVGADPMFAAAVDYYLLRDRMPLSWGSVTPSMRIAHSMVVVVPGREQATAIYTARKLGSEPGQAQLLRAFDHTSVWRVEILAG
jgi:hypothetical protein